MKINRIFYTAIDKAISKVNLLLIAIIFWMFVIYPKIVFGAVAPPPAFKAAVPEGAYPKIDAGRVKLKAEVPEEAGAGGYVRPDDRPKHEIKKTAQEEQPQATPQAAPASLKFPFLGIRITGSTLYNKKTLSKYYKSFLGKEVSFADLDKIVDGITAHYRKDGYVLSRALLPAQEIKSGIVEVQVVEGFISEVYIEGDVGKARAIIEAIGKKIKQMRPLHEKKLERYVFLLNDISGLTVKTVLSPSATQLGAADLTFIVEQSRLTADISFDNRGGQYMGPREAIGVLALNEFITKGDSFGLQTIHTPIANEMHYIQGIYSLPLGLNGWSIKGDASFTETRPGFTIEEMKLLGRSKSWGVELDYSLMRSRSKNIYLWTKFEWLDTYTRFRGDYVFFDKIRSLMIGFTGDFADSFHGGNLIGFTISKGLTNLPISTVNENEEPATSRVGGRGDYFKINGTFSRYQSLGERTVLLIAAEGQCSFKKMLLSSEQTGFGGQIFGRGYDSSEISGDSGLVTKLELRVNTFPSLRFLQQIQWYSFYDMGFMWLSGAENGRSTGNSLGIGLRATLDGYFYGNIELAKPLTSGVATQKILNANPNSWRVFFNVGIKI
jgi:hemolysin activation/secretion protein